MELRPELCPPAVSTRRVAELRAAIERITDLIERGAPADAAITAFNTDTGHDYTAEHFLAYAGSRAVENVAVEAARPAWPKVPSLTRDELIEIVRRIMAADDDTDYYLLLLKANVPHPEADGLIFWPPPELVDAPPERIVDAALRHAPIAL